MGAKLWSKKMEKYFFQPNSNQKINEFWHSVVAVTNTTHYSHFFGPSAPFRACSKYFCCFLDHLHFFVAVLLLLYIVLRSRRRRPLLASLAVLTHHHRVLFIQAQGKRRVFTTLSPAAAAAGSKTKKNINGGAPLPTPFRCFCWLAAAGCPPTCCWLCPWSVASSFSSSLLPLLAAAAAVAARRQRRRQKSSRSRQKFG